MTQTDTQLCIYCLTHSTSAPPEHVIPEVLGCPEGAILRSGEVCKQCNNGLAHLDTALADSFDIARFFANQPSKRGKGPSVTGRSNFVVSSEKGKPVIHVNLGPGDVTLPGGRILKAPRKGKDSVRGSMRIDGRIVSMHFEAQAFQNPKLSRALHKVAIGSIAVTLNRETALAPSLNEARSFALKGEGLKRRICFQKPKSNPRYTNQLFPPYKAENGYLVVVKLCGFEFVVDCTPEQTALPKLFETTKKVDPSVEWVVLS